MLVDLDYFFAQCEDCEIPRCAASPWSLAFILGELRRVAP